MRLLHKLTGTGLWRRGHEHRPRRSIVAIDVHTHAEEPCGSHADDGYDDFQAAMAAYFKSPHPHPPTIPETAAYYRERRIAAVIFPVDAERETGFRRYKQRGGGGSLRRRIPTS